jgi:hypothetical protein
MFGGTPDIATSIDDCKLACTAYSGCDGFDWVEDEPVGSQCWLTGSWTTGINEGAAYGVTHYIFVNLCGKTVRDNIAASPADKQRQQLEQQKGHLHCYTS